MKNWDTDKIIGAGLIVALIFYFTTVLIIAIVRGEIMPLEVASNIITGLIGYMGKTLFDKMKHSPDDDKADINNHDKKKGDINK